MLKVDLETLDRLEGMYPGFKRQVQSLENANLPACAICESADTASVQVGVIGRSINLAGSTTKFKLVANGTKPGKFFCNQCNKFFSDEF